MERTVVKITIVGDTEEHLIRVRDKVIKEHLVAGLTYDEPQAMYWCGGQVMSHKAMVMRGITFYEKIRDIEKVLPDGVTISSACPSTYVNPKTERWLNDSVG